MATCWEHLEISQTQSKRDIKRAYARLLKHCHPEEHPEEFQRLNDMYRQALSASENFVEDIPEEENISHEGVTENIYLEQNHDVLRDTFDEANLPFNFSAKERSYLLDDFDYLKSQIEVSSVVKHGGWQALYQDFGQAVFRVNLTPFLEKIQKETDEKDAENDQLNQIANQFLIDCRSILSSPESCNNPQHWQKLLDLPQLHSVTFRQAITLYVFNEFSQHYLSVGTDDRWVPHQYLQKFADIFSWSDYELELAKHFSTEAIDVVMNELLMEESEGRFQTRTRLSDAELEKLKESGNQFISELHQLLKSRAKRARKKEWTLLLENENLDSDVFRYLISHHVFQEISQHCLSGDFKKGFIPVDSLKSLVQLFEWKRPEEQLELGKRFSNEALVAVLDRFSVYREREHERKRKGMPLRILFYSFLAFFFFIGFLSHLLDKPSRSNVSSIVSNTSQTRDTVICGQGKKLFDDCLSAGNASMKKVKQDRFLAEPLNNQSKVKNIERQFNQRHLTSTNMLRLDSSNAELPTMHLRDMTKGDKEKLDMNLDAEQKKELDAILRKRMDKAINGENQ